ncbi:MAG: enoyl-CoA hydratase/isomerase family protein [Bacillota bacterium]
MNYKYVSLDRQGPISEITMNRPEVLNAYHIEMLEELKAVLIEVFALEETSVVILTGRGSKAFSVGADINWLESLDEKTARKISWLGKDICNLIEEGNKVVIAAVNGYALGGGMEIALACDLRIASSRARFGQPEVKLGLVPGFDGTQRLPRIIGVGRAKEMLFTGNIVDANTAYEIGLANRLVTPRDLLRSSRKLARDIADQSIKAVGLVKEAINNGMREGRNAGSSYETEAFGACFSLDDHEARIKQLKDVIDHGEE